MLRSRNTLSTLLCCYKVQRSARFYLHDVVFVEDLDSYVLLAALLQRQIDLAEGPLTQGTLYLKILDGDLGAV